MATLTESLKVKIAGNKPFQDALIFHFVSRLQNFLMDRDEEENGKPKIKYKNSKEHKKVNDEYVSTYKNSSVEGSKISRQIISLIPVGTTVSDTFISGEFTQSDIDNLRAAIDKFIKFTARVEANDIETAQ